MILRSMQPQPPIVPKLPTDVPVLDPNEQYTLLVGFKQPDCHPILLTLKALARGTLILGRPGSGKSFMARLIVRQLVFYLLVATIVIDAEGDLCEDGQLDVIGHCCDQQSESILHRTHVLRPDWKTTFQIDPFECPDHISDPLQYDAWLRRQVSLMCNAIIRALGEVSLEHTPRLKRWLENVLIAIGTAVGPDQKRLPLANIFILLDVQHPKFDLVYGHIRPHLPLEIQQDFDQLISMRNRPQDVLGQIESTINRIRSLMQPLVQAAFSRVADQQHPGSTVNFLQLIRQRAIVFINLKDTQYFSPEQADALGKIMIYLVITAMQGVSDKGERVPCALVIDEFQRFVTEDILRGLCQGRKWGLCTILITQTLSYIEMVQEGFTDIILSVVETIICYQQLNPKDLDTLSRRLYQGNLDHTEKAIEVDRNRGKYWWHRVDEVSEGVTNSTTWAKSLARSLGVAATTGTTRADSWGIGKAVARLKNWASSESTSNIESSGTTTSAGNSQNTGHGMHAHPILNGNHVVGSVLSGSLQQGSGNFSSCGEQQSSGTANTAAESEGGGISDVDSHNVGGANSRVNMFSRSQNVTETNSHGGATAHSRTVAHKLVPLPIIETEIQYQGTPAYDYTYQLEQFKSLLYKLPPRFAVVARAGHESVVVETPFIQEPFENLQLRSHLLKNLEAKLRQIHGYFASPKDLAKENQQRVDQFIGMPSSHVVVPSSSQPTPPSTRSTFI